MIWYPTSYRLLKLLQEIAAETENKTMIFVETKRKVDEITRALSRYGLVCCHSFFFPLYICIV